VAKMILSTKLKTRSSHSARIRACER